ncbi:uncharacterized protein KIAA2026-like [Anneissia japonica]|uniref:uncharacterized protein KIAA2026-like n=1 Tax=Anneissia japonica TaxID=1529436 RepID=UPI00142581ED|nr:uncharacterized protein KIAA2026-like [Anneissia japonica]
MDQRAIVLGEDSDGNTYVHFPQFCGYDLRIYKQAPFPEPELRYIEVDEPDEPVKMDSESEECFTSNGKQNKDKDKDVELTPEPRKRPSNLRQKLTPTINSLVRGGRRSTRTSKSSQELSTVSVQSTVSNCNHLNNLSNSKSQSDNLKLSSEDDHIKNKENIEQENCVKMGCKLEVSDLSSREESTDIPADQVESKSNINNEDKNHNNSNSVQPSGSLTEDLKYDDKPAIRKMMENQKLNGQIDIKTENLVSNTNLKEPKTPANESSKFDMKFKDEDNDKDSGVIEKGHEKEGKINKESRMVDWMREEKVKSRENEKDENCLENIESNSKEEHVKPKLILPNVEPDRAAFTLVCDSIDSLKSLVEEFAEREPVEVTKGRRKKIIKPPARTESEVELHETLTRLLMELAPHESKLCNAVVRVKERLRKEFNNFQDSQDESDSWECESSSGSSSTSDSDSSESDDKEEENKNEEEQEEKPVDEEEAMETIEPFLGISTRAQKISKKRKLIEAKKKAKLGGNEDHTEAKKKCLSPVNITTYNPENPILGSFPVGNLAASQRSLTSVTLNNIHQTLQQQIAAACDQPQGNHSMNSTMSIPEKTQSEKNLVKTQLAALPECTIVVDDAVWKEIQNDPQRQKEVVLKYLLQQTHKLSGQRDQKLKTTLSSQEINHDAIGGTKKLPIPKSGLLSIPPEAFGVPSVSKQPTFGQPPVFLLQTTIDSQKKARQTQDLPTMSREPGEGAQKEILMSKLSAVKNIPTLCSTSSSPSVGTSLNILHSTSGQVTPAERICTPSKEKLQLTEAQIKENKVNEAKKKKENMLAQQWLQQLILLQQATSKAPTLSTSQVEVSQSNVKHITKVSTVANMTQPSGLKTNVRPLLSSELISQAAKLLQKKPNSNSAGYVELVKKVQQLPNESKGAVFIPNAICTSIPSSGVKTIGDGNLLKIQNHATSTSNMNKANQEVVVSLDYLQKLQQQSKLKHSNATLINQQVNANPQNTAQRNLIVLKTSGSPGSGDATPSTENAVMFTKSQSSISPNAFKLPTTVANTKVVHQQIVATNQGKICLVKMADGTLRALNLVQQKAPVKKNILSSSLLSNQSTPLSLKTPTPKAAISMVNKPQLNGSALGSTLMTQKPPAVTNNPSNLSSVKTAPSLVLPSPSPVVATNATTLSENTTSRRLQNTAANIILSGEEYKTYMHLGVLPSRSNNQNQSQTTECTVSHQSLEKHNEILNTSVNVDSTSTLKGNYQDICGSSTSITGCANIVVNELLVRNKATNDGSQNKFNQE